ncbi:hypothetical protein KOAAANKH_02041 [Brevundimonas sp. NIBR10]|uniref:hypothetical protein n=1 Tax=Brevundimonas sp. NIBR10 TaxID=3015997 RepID=UPI0022F17FB4|nr:hypothetical protein [Brevundimonas sp. NIBR10]WGM47166.1 hypothetical protein KOAAANKH_02041 [Brevundimonas sp. NIBR10]
MHITPELLAAVATLVTALSDLVWAFRRRACPPVAIHSGENITGTIGFWGLIS